VRNRTFHGHAHNLTVLLGESESILKNLMTNSAVREVMPKLARQKITFGEMRAACC
jgi:hypothetical protein